MDTSRQESVLGTVSIASRIDALDHLNESTSILRGVSDALLALSERPSDYQDVIRMFSDIALHQSHVVGCAEAVLEKELSSKLGAVDKDVRDSDCIVKDSGRITGSG